MTTITLPAVEPMLALTIEAEAAAVAVESETAAFAAILKRFGPLAQHGQRIKTASYVACAPGRRIDINECDYLRDASGKLSKGLILIDNWEESRDSQNSGRINGDALVLTESGFHLLEYSGAWSHWQGAPDWWECGGTTQHIRELHAPYGPGNRAITPAEAAARFDLADVLAGLSKALTETADRLPKRMARAHPETRLRLVANGFFVEVKR